MKNLLPTSFLYVCFRIFPLIFLSVSGTDLFAQFDYGKTYINVTKSTNGGSVVTGDTIEIRATFVVKSGTYDSCGFFDVIPAGTAYVPSSLRILTNEGKIYKSFTDAITDDCGYRNGANIRINLGFSPGINAATAYKRGRIRNTDRPSNYGTACIMVASYRLRVTSALGTTINLGGGSFSYKPTGLPLSSVTFGADNVAVSQDYGFCGNSVGANALNAEVSGTFGSGKPRNRGTSASVAAGYTYDVLHANGPNDYYYGVPNNTSINSGYTTVNSWPKPDLTHRVFGLWDIIGDHTGATNPLAGNPAADTVANPNAGYMLVINAAYKTDTAFSYTVTGLCPNTYYEISAWLRNICSKCGCDSMGRTAGTAGYIPTAPGDSSGVYPNLTFGINGVDYYSTGSIKYTGQWVKKGFNYRTGPAQTSFTMFIRNNAPGGGGNDWAIDDIAIATCTPNLLMTPSPTAVVCEGNQVNMSCTVRSFFSNYVNYQWEKSINGGATWTNTGVSGNGSPAMVTGQYEYTANYPSFTADTLQNLHKYRLRVSSTPANLATTTCSFTDPAVITLQVSSCYALQTDIIYMNGVLKNGYTDLQWTTTNEGDNIIYNIERSLDGVNYIRAGTIMGRAPGTASSYHFMDPEPVTAQTFYRIKVAFANSYKYSKTLLLSPSKLHFDIKSVLNPFNNKLAFEVISPITGTTSITLVDNYGVTVRSYLIRVEKGLQIVNLENLDGLKTGIYTLHIQSGDVLINKRVIKLVE